MTYVTCRPTAKNRDQPLNRTLGNRVWATFSLLFPFVDERRPHLANISLIEELRVSVIEHLPTRSAANAEGPRNALCRSKCCQQQDNCRNKFKQPVEQIQNKSNKAVRPIDHRLRPRCCLLGSYVKRPKSSPVRPLACSWYYCAQLIAKPKAACALRLSWAATSSNVGL